MEWVQGEVSSPGPWQQAVDGCDAVVHLAGESIASGRWTPRRKQELSDSRILSTRQIVAAMQEAHSPPRVLVNGSAVGFYGPRGSEELDESSAPGQDFLAGLCVAWEREAQEAVAFRHAGGLSASRCSPERGRGGAVKNGVALPARRRRITGSARPLVPLGPRG